MSKPSNALESAWGQAELAAKLFAVDPASTGICLRARAGSQRERWLAYLQGLMPARPLGKLPGSIADDRLFGGLDLAATLAAGRAVAERGALAGADGGAILIPSAERLSATLAARLAAVHDSGEVLLQRDGLSGRFSARFGLILLDEGIEPDEHPPAALLDRIAIGVDLSAVPLAQMRSDALGAGEIAEAMARLPGIMVRDEAIEAICAASLALGIGSARAPILALRVARITAALDQRSELSEADLRLAAQFVLAWRAETLPPSDSADEPAEDRQELAPSEPEDGADERETGTMNDVVLDAARAALPPDLLAKLLADRARDKRPGPAGRVGALQKAGKRGKRTGVTHGNPRGGARLDLIATMREAAPWQRIRQTAAYAHPDRKPAPIKIRASDFRVIRFAERRETLTIFAVDASGSLALNRLAEAKGAVELLLADCYKRRDQVALIAFRGHRADLLLPPTRSLVRAKRCLSGLPGGGGTPIASGMDAAAVVAQSALRRGRTSLIVMLTDGSANVARDGSPGRAAAHADAILSAKLLRQLSVKSLLIDTAPRPAPRASAIAEAMGATYLALPRTDANAISAAVKSAWGPRRG